MRGRHRLGLADVGRRDLIEALQAHQPHGADEFVFEDLQHAHDAFRTAAAGPLGAVLAVSDEPLVSVDYTGSWMSATVDAEFTSVVGGDLVQAIAWYDNEMGYSTRVVELVEYIGARL